ncbi:MAG: formate dehydrogenase, partial [Methylophilaceae bacterium]
MGFKIFVPIDSTSLSLGADDVADLIAATAKKRNIDVTIIRNGSRGMFWLEPLVEVETDDGRLAYGPIE